MPRDQTERMCEFCGEGPECAVCGRGKRPEPATVAAPEYGVPAVVRKAQEAGLRVINYYRRNPGGPMTLVVAES